MIRTPLMPPFAAWPGVLLPAVRRLFLSKAPICQRRIPGVISESLPRRVWFRAVRILFILKDFPNGVSPTASADVALRLGIILKILVKNRTQMVAVGDLNRGRRALPPS